MQEVTLADGAFVRFLGSGAAVVLNRPQSVDCDEHIVAVAHCGGVALFDRAHGALLRQLPHCVTPAGNVVTITRPLGIRLLRHGGGVVVADSAVGVVSMTLSGGALATSRTSGRVVDVALMEPGDGSGMYFACPSLRTVVPVDYVGVLASARPGGLGDGEFSGVAALALLADGSLLVRDVTAVDLDGVAIMSRVQRFKTAATSARYAWVYAVALLAARLV